MTELTIRPMSRLELDMGVAWAAAEGWNPGLHDADTFHAADPGGFLLGLLGSEPVGMVSAVRYGQGFGFIGFYIVRPTFRGQGHGMALWRAGMARLARRTIGLDGVVAQQDNYRQSGFELAHHNMRYQGVAGQVATLTPITAPAQSTLGAPAPNHSAEPSVADMSGVTPAVHSLAGVSADAVCGYDRAFFPDERSVFVRHWLAQRGSTALGVRGAGGQWAGYGVIRPCRSGYKVGPLLADTPALAAQLFDALVGCVPPGTSVQLDVPCTNPHAVALAESRHMEPVFQTARMYAGPAPALPLDRQYGVTTFELG